MKNTYIIEEIGQAGEEKQAETDCADSQANNIADMIFEGLNNRFKLNQNTSASSYDSVDIANDIYGQYISGIEVQAVKKKLIKILKKRMIKYSDTAAEAATAMSGGDKHTVSIKNTAKSVRYGANNYIYSITYLMQLIYENTYSINEHIVIV